MAIEVLSRRVDLTPITVSVVALGYLGALVVFPSGLSDPALLTVVASTLVLLGGVNLVTGGWSRSVGVFVLLYLSLSAITWGLLTTLEGITTVTLLLAGGIALGSYGLHRYELVAVGLVGDDHEY